MFTDCTLGSQDPTQEISSNFDRKCRSDSKFGISAQDIIWDIISGYLMGYHKGCCMEYQMGHNIWNV